MSVNYGCSKKSNPLKTIRIDWVRLVVGLDFDTRFFCLGLLLKTQE